MSRDWVSGGLRVRLESPLPASLEVGRATAIYCAGRCWHSHERIARLEIAVAGERHLASAVGMPRPDVFAEVHAGLAPPGRGDRHALARSADPNGRSYRSGFWSTVPIRSRQEPGSVALEAVVRLGGGTEHVAPLGEVRIVEPVPAPPCPDVPYRRGEGLVAICMATCEPDDALFRVQVESLRAQTDERWICVISDDCSAAGSFERILATVGPDPRFVVSRSPERRGFYRNFERALEMVPNEAELVALCDQDDRWHPNKLAVLRQALGGSRLVYSDQRLVSSDGRVLRSTFWRGRRNNYTNLASMLIANTITGAASLMHREIVDLALPFPETPGLQFHDHWIAIVALATGDIAYVDRPLYDYVQHGEAVLGQVGLAQPGVAPRSTGLRRIVPPGTFDRWRRSYYFGYLSREVQAQTVLARCEDRLTPRRRRALRRYIAAQSSFAALAWLTLRAPLRAVAGRNETLGTELELVQGVLWRRLVGLRATRPPWSGGKVVDTGYPPLDAMGVEQRRLRRWRAGV